MISYIIPFRGRTPDRIRNLKIHLNRIVSFELGFEIIICEQDSESRISDIIKDKKIKHLLFRDNGPFQKSVLINSAVKHSSNDILILCDCDTLMTQLSIQKMIEISKGYEVTALKKCIYLTERGTTNAGSFKNKDMQFISSDIQKNRFTMIGGAFTIIKKESFWKIKGFNENFVSWGYEDREFEHRCLSFLAPIHYNSEFVCWHMNHSRFINKSITEKNRKLRDTIRRTSKSELLQNLEKISIESLGKSNQMEVLRE